VPSEPNSARVWIEWFPLPVLTLSALACRNFLQPWEFMWLLAVAIYLGLKWVSWWKARSRVAHTAGRSLVYLLAWPGMDAESFLDSRQRVSPPSLRSCAWALFKTACGAALLWGVARALPENELLLQGWVGMIGFILVLHFGSFEMIALLWQRRGVNAGPIMSAPLRSTSLSEFWGKRWNLGFRQLSYDLIFRPLHRKWGAGLAGFLVFVTSGLIHDLVISVPARGGYGRPTIYFVLQGLGVAIERSAFGRQLGLREGARGWLFMAAFTAAPVFLLFHPPFVLRVMVPFLEAIHAL
jgi:Membrane bound O-acyl transferase family